MQLSPVRPGTLKNLSGAYGGGEQLFGRQACWSGNERRACLSCAASTSDHGMRPLEYSQPPVERLLTSRLWCCLLPSCHPRQWLPC